MRAGDRQGRQVGGEEIRPRLHLIGMAAKAPALVGLAHVATQRIGHDLVAEADAEHRGVCCVRAADEGAQWLEPGQVVIDTGRRAGDEDRFEPGGVRKPGAVVDRHGVVRKAEAGLVEHPHEHRCVETETGAQRRRHFASLDDGELHGAQDLARFAGRFKRVPRMAPLQKKNPQPCGRGLPSLEVGTGYAAVA